MVADEDDLDMEEDGFGEMDFSQMSQKQLRKMYPNLPVWFFYSAKKKRQFFSGLNKKYYERIDKENRVL